jgi:hypothetical protein
VTVSWTQATLSGGTAVTGYVVNRSDASTGTQQTTGAGCAGTIAALTCTEYAVPAGSWKYSVTPRYSSWWGAESARSATVTVAAPSLTLAGSTTLTTLPGTLNGSVASFATGETLDELAEALGEAIAQMVESETWQKTLKDRGWLDLYLPSDEFAQFLEEDSQQVATVLKDIGLVQQ